MQESRHGPVEVTSVTSSSSSLGMYPTTFSSISLEVVLRKGMLGGHSESMDSVVAGDSGQVHAG